MINEALYDKTNPESIEKYAKKLIGHTFNDVLKKLHIELLCRRPEGRRRDFD